MRTGSIHQGLWLPAIQLEAGGHLACVVAYRSKNPAIKGVLNFYGATEWKYYFDKGGKLLNLLKGKLLQGGATDGDFKAAHHAPHMQHQALHHF